MKRSLKYLFITLATFISLPSLAADSYDGGIIYMSPGETKTISNSGGMNQYNHYNGFDWSWGVWPAGSWSGTVVSGINIVSSSFNQCTIKANSNLKDHDMELTFSFYYWQYSQYTDMNKYVYDFTYLIKYKEPEGIKIDEDHFPDENFRNYLLGMSYGKDGILTDSEISQISSFSFYKKDIKSLKGIEYFTALKNLACDNNPLTELDISNNTALEKLTCLFCQLTSLDVSKNTALTYLDCQKNKLTTLDVSKNTALSYLSFGYNQLANIDVSKNTALEGLVCFDNQLTALDVSKNTALRTLSCDGNQLTTLDVSNNLALRWLSCGETQFTTLDVSKNTALTHLSCIDGELTTLDVSKNTALTELNCRDCKLTTLDVSKNTALKELDCGSNKLTSLDVSKNVALERLYCYINRLTTLDLSRNAALEYVYCYDNQLTSLVVANNSNLYEIEFHMNLISGENMDILINSLPMNTTGEEHHFVLATKSDEQNCTKAQVEAIKAKGWLPKYVDGDDYDGYIYVTDIALNNTTLNLNLYDTYSLIATVEPDNATDKTVSWSSSNTSIATVDSNGKVTAVGTGTASITCTANDGSGVEATCTVTVGKPEGIEINTSNFPDENFRSYLLSQSYGEDGVLTAEEIKNVRGINVDRKNISSLKGIECFTALSWLHCISNKLIELDISKNIALTELYCYYNQLTALDVSKNTALTWLSSSNNKLTVLDVSKNTALKRLECGDNQLTELDVSKNTALTYLYCSSNQLTALDVSKNAVLQYLHCDNNKIRGKAMDDLISSLPQNTTSDQHRFRVISPASNSEGNVCTKVQVAAVKTKGWFPCYYDSDTKEYVEYEGSEELKPISITLQSPATVIYGQTIKLKPEITPANAVTTLTWTSDDETIATVDANGVVTGIKKGQTFINVETDNGKMAYCKLTVTAGEPTAIALPKNVTVIIGEPLKLTPTLTPEDAETVLTWYSDDETIVRVTADGTLIGVAEGLAIVTAKASNGITSNACKVKVELPSAISDVQADIKAKTPIYTVSGQRIKTLRKGINIVGGKKVVIK